MGMASAGEGAMGPVLSGLQEPGEPTLCEKVGGAGALICPERGGRAGAPWTSEAMLWGQPSQAP